MQLRLKPGTISRIAKGLFQHGLIYGVIGVLQSDGTYTFTRRSDNMVAVTLDDGTRTYAVVQGINALVGGKRVAMREIGNRLVIVSGDTNGDLNERVTDIIPTTIRGTGAEQIVDSLLITEGLVLQQSSSLIVLVLPVTYRDLNGSIARKAATTYVDLTSSVPGTAGQRRYAVIVLDRTDGTVAAVNGATTTTALTAADLVAASLLCTPEQIPLGFVDVRNGDTTIYWDRITDARLFAPGLDLPIAVTVTDATYTVKFYQTHVYCNRAGTIGLTLPTAANAQYQQELVIVDVSGGASGNTITITRAGSDTINGATTTTITTDYGVVRLKAFSSSAWVIVG